METRVYPFQNIGALADAPKINVDDTGIDVYTLTQGMRGVIFYNTGPDICWLGGSTTVSAVNKRGMELLPKVAIQFDKPNPDFTAGLRCDTGKTAEVTIMEYR